VSSQHLQSAWVVALAVALAGAGCAARRQVGQVGPVGEVEQVQQSPETPATAAAPVSPAPSAPAPDPAPAPAQVAPDSSNADQASAPSADTVFSTTLRPLLLESARAADRRKKFAAAVVKISAELGVPISAEQALREMPCGGWSGPDCSNLTIGLEIAKGCAPVIASFHGRRTADIATVLVDAVTVHSIWHDAYGYVRRVKKKGPGYTYAGCLFSRCDPEDLANGQVDGLLYQVGRLLGTVKSPACGPTCALGDL